MRANGMICVGTLAVILALALDCGTDQTKVAPVSKTAADVQEWRIDLDNDGVDDFFLAVAAGGDRVSAPECPTGLVLYCDLPLDVCGVYYCVRPGYLLCYACGDGFCVPNAAWCTPGDIDLVPDGDVDLDDLNMFLDNFTGPWE